MRERGPQERGAASAIVLVLLLFLSALFLNAVLLLELSLRQLRRAEERDARRHSLAREAGRTLRLLLEDPTPLSDSPRDPVWEGIRRPEESGCTVELQDLSSRLGLNWVRKELLESLGVLNPGRSAQELQQFREDSGIHLNLAPAFQDFFAEDDLATLFTSYNYFNINICDEFALRMLHFLRSGDLAMAEEFHMEVQQLRIQKKTLDPASLEQAIGTDDYRLLYPILNAEPVMNLHFVPASVLRGLFRYYRVPTERAESILEARPYSEFSPAELESLLGQEAYQKTPLRQFLGVRTWFWRIRASCGEDTLVWVIARLPGTEEPVKLRLLEERFSP